MTSLISGYLFLVENTKFSFWEMFSIMVYAAFGGLLFGMLGINLWSTWTTIGITILYTQAIWIEVAIRNVKAQGLL